MRIGNLVLGDGRPAIIAPIAAADLEGTLRAAHDAPGRGADMIEWRCDMMLPASGEEIAATALRLRTILSPLPLLVTLRTDREGGDRSIGAAEYAEALDAVILREAADALDVEMLQDERSAQDLASRARRCGIRVIGSHHDFEATPSVQDMVGMLRRCAELGADVAKLAVMPTSRRDVLDLLEATHVASESLDVPVITISMGRLGAVTRVGGGAFGSAATFASIGHTSAPGQLAADRLVDALDLLDG